MLPWLDEESVAFPNPETALLEPNGLLAAGGDLSSKRLRAAYKAGIFPWYSEGEPILWWSPDPRTVIFPGKLHISKSLQKALNKTPFTFTHNTAFEQVIEACSEPRGDSGTENPENGTWILPEMKAAYINLHKQGVAQSMECWLKGQLVGGIYGIVLGKCFFGESMFSRVSNASKAVMVALDQHLQAHDFSLLDCQVSSPHLLSMGAVEIPRQQFLRLVKSGLHQ